MCCRSVRLSLLSELFLRLNEGHTHHVGSTNTAILGALEPLTAIFFGILVFHEHLTFRISVGIVLILTAVSIIISEKTISAHLKLLFHRRQALH